MMVGREMRAAGIAASSSIWSGIRAEDVERVEADERLDGSLRCGHTFGPSEITLRRRL
jgi:hypothetical protein